MNGIIIGGGVVARPLQFQLEKFITMNGIIEKQDPGWDDIDKKIFFIGVRAISMKMLSCLQKRTMRNVLSYIRQGTSLKNSPQKK